MYITVSEKNFKKRGRAAFRIFYFRLLEGAQYKPRKQLNIYE